LTKKEHVTLQKLQKDPSIMITKADKSNITTVLDKEWYDHKTKKMQDNRETYKHLKNNATASSTQDVNKFVTLLESTKITKKQVLDWKTQMPQHPVVRTTEITKRKQQSTETNSFFHRLNLPTG